MGARRLLLGLCSLQLLATLERQVFDFLGFMWAPILANFLHLLFVIFGFFGAFQRAPKYICSYSLWNLIWLGWNAFIICYYMNVGTLDRDSGLLALGTGSVSWWRINGWGCRVRWGDIEGNPWVTEPKEVEGCYLHFTHVEVAHGALQSLLAVIGIILGFYYVSTLSKSDDNGRSTSKSVGSQSLYSIEFTRPPEIRAEPAAKPMTPRRVKRRSVSSRHSTRRSSRRSSQRHGTHRTGTGHTNPTYRQSSQHSLNDSYNDEDLDLYNNRPASVRSSYSNFHGARPISLHTDGSIYPESSFHSDGYFINQAPSPNLSAAEATPQVPQKRVAPETASTSSMPYRIYGNQSAFLNNGPPAYHLHQNPHHPPPDNETVM